jgi:hypothetical protein
MKQLLNGRKATPTFGMPSSVFCAIFSRGDHGGEEEIECVVITEKRR